MEVKRLKLEDNTFMANGVKYYYSSRMCIDRFMEFERLQAHVGFGKDFKHIHEKLVKCYNHLNKNELADGAVIVHNLVNGIAMNLEKREHPMLEMCALFINREDEDTAVFDEDMNKQKIADWKKEGYSVEDFFQLAFNFVEGFIPIYNDLIQNISEEVEEVVSSSGKKE